MDRKLVASQQEHEIKFISNRYRIPIKHIEQAIGVVGISRRKIYKYLREKLGYVFGKIKNANQ